MINYEEIKKTDPEIYQAIIGELKRQSDNLELIASENYVDYPVLEATGCIMTNKYAEGYPYRKSKKTGELTYRLSGRYYGGCDFVNDAERLAIERAKELFGAEHANVQAHSGSQANMAVYFAVLEPGDKMMGMSLSHGGHLTHGHTVSFSGIFYEVVQYGVSAKTEQLDYDEIMEFAIQEKPKLIMCGASAYPRIIDFKKFKEIADEVGAYLVADIAHIAGLIVAGLHPSPVPYADFVTTTTHKTLRGPRAGLILCKKKYQEILDKTVMPGIQGGPLMHVIAAKAIALKLAQTNEFKEYQRQIVKNASALANALIDRGFNLVSGGTDNHLMLINLGKKGEGPSGKKMEKSLDKAGITANKNTVPFDTRSPFVASGIRLGTPALTTRGMKEKEMEQIAEFIKQVYDNIENDEKLAMIRNEVRELCSRFPIYEELKS
ncbi:MAG: serine hydroxymethyltransferase [Candidatus Cloacimonetes bacterium]|nr:serine hydroxymethyltransferase [Candidatus Cloacimonadota bacterium]